jgi:ParB-like chromosome segregation protein Spo0J
MTQPAEGPAFHSIEKLLEQSVQPFPDLPAERFDELCLSIHTQGLQNPILLSEDGFLYDGHQRLKALLAGGRKRISATDVRVQRGVTRANMLEHAYTSNIVRRHLTSADKAAAMHQCVARGWSQRKIARTFGMSQPGVSQLLAAHPSADVPDVIITEGDDGKTYTRTKPTIREPEPRPRSTEADRRARITKRLATVRQSLSHVLADAGACGYLDAFERGAITEDVNYIRGMLDTLLAALAPEADKS